MMCGLPMPLVIGMGHLAIDCRVSYWPDHHLLVEPMRIIVSNTVTGASR
jgi:hypothetical protein